MSEFDPYQVLGVARDADEAMIRKAYREVAKVAHPDRGGAPDHWERVRLSYDTLIDPMLRRGYDEMGAIGEKAVDNDRASALQVIDQHLGSVLNEYLLDPQGRQPWKDPRKKNVVAAIQAKIRTEIQRGRDALPNGREVAEFFDDMRRRFKVKDEVAAAEDSIHKMLEHQSAMTRKQLADIEKSVRVHELALKLLDDGWEFEPDVPPQLPGM